MMSLKSKNELLEVVRPRYLKASKFEKQKILDEFTSATGYHRKHVIFSSAGVFDPAEILTVGLNQSRRYASSTERAQGAPRPSDSSVAENYVFDL